MHKFMWMTNKWMPGFSLHRLPEWSSLRKRPVERRLFPWGPGIVALRWRWLRYQGHRDLTSEGQRRATAHGGEHHQRAHLPRSGCLHLVDLWLHRQTPRSTWHLRVRVRVRVRAEHYVRVRRHVCTYYICFGRTYTNTTARGNRAKSNFRLFWIIWSNKAAGQSENNHYKL